MGVLTAFSSKLRSTAERGYKSHPLQAIHTLGDEQPLRTMENTCIAGAGIQAAGWFLLST